MNLIILAYVLIGPIPLLRDKPGNVNGVNNYRTFTLISVVSKVLEGVILTLRNNFVTVTAKPKVSTANLYKIWTRNRLVRSVSVFTMKINNRHEPEPKRSIGL